MPLSSELYPHRGHHTSSSSDSTIDIARSTTTWSGADPVASPDSVGGPSPLNSPEPGGKVWFQDSSSHHYGHSYRTTNIVHGSGPSYFINHAENANITAHADSLLWESLPRHPPFLGARDGYLANSRAEDEKALWGWLDDPAAELVLHIYGAAGSGKTTFAQHIKQQLRSRDRLAASVFLTALKADYLSPVTVVQLIAGELGRIHSNTIPIIVDAVRRCHETPLQNQLEKFIRDPLRSLQLEFPLVVVLDAVDEWISHHLFLEALPCLNQHSNLVRFILLGRSEPNSTHINGPSMRSHALRPISNEVMENYISRRFELIEWEDGTKPTARDATQLAEKAHGLFIWTATACALLEDGLSLSSPQDTLSAILQSRRSLGDSYNLAQLYHDVITLLFPTPEAQDAVRMFLGATMVLQEALPLTVFSTLVGMRQVLIKGIQVKLKALQIRKPVDPQPTVHPAYALYHLSFIEYLQSNSTPGTFAFHVPPFDHHSRLGEGCLKELGSFLPTAQQLDSLYLSPVRSYAVKHWILHASCGTPSVEPGLDSQWKETAIYSILQEFSILKYQQWKVLFIRVLKSCSPEAEPEKKSKKSCSNESSRCQDSEAGRLMLDVAKPLSAKDPSMVAFKISCLSVSVRFRPDDETIWCALGWAYWHLARITASDEAVNLAVAAHRNALKAGEASNSAEKAELFLSLATSLGTRFLNLRDPDDLEQSISLQRRALDLRPPGQPNRSTPLNNLAYSLRIRYQRKATEIDLEEAVELFKEALVLRPPGHSGRILSLNNLGNALRFRFERTGSDTDIEEVIRLHQQVLVLRAHGHPDRPCTLNNIANALRSRFEKTGRDCDLEEAMRLYKEALNLSPEGHPERQCSLWNIATALQTQFQSTGSSNDLEEAIKLYRDILVVRPLGHPDRHSTLKRLAYSLTLRYEIQGVANDLDESISCARESLAAQACGHPGHKHILGVLALALRFRSEHLDESVGLIEEALSLTRTDDPQRVFYLQSHATILLCRYQQSGIVKELDQAIASSDEALALCSPQFYLRRTLSRFKEELADLRSSLPRLLDAGL